MQALWAQGLYPSGSHMDTSSTYRCAQQTVNGRYPVDIGQDTVMSPEKSLCFYLGYRCGVRELRENFTEKRMLQLSIKRLEFTK